MKSIEQLNKDEIKQEFIEHMAKELSGKTDQTMFNNMVWFLDRFLSLTEENNIILIQLSNPFQEQTQQNIQEQHSKPLNVNELIKDESNGYTHPSLREEDEQEGENELEELSEEDMIFREEYLKKIKEEGEMYESEETR